MLKIKKSDQVIVITGKDKGKKGRVTDVHASGKVVVEGVNVVKCHQKPNPTRGITGGIVEKSIAIAISNVALYNPATNKADRVGFRLLADGRKVRFFKSTNDVVDL